MQVVVKRVYAFRDIRRDAVRLSLWVGLPEYGLETELDASNSIELDGTGWHPELLDALQSDEYDLTHGYRMFDVDATEQLAQTRKAIVDLGGTITEYVEEEEFKNV